MIYQTRKAKHGTQYRYRITYTDAGDTGCPDFTVAYWAYDREDAEEQFSEDGDDWKILKVERLKN